MPSDCASVVVCSLSNVSSTTPCGGSSRRPPAAAIAARWREIGSVVRSLIGRTSVPGSRAASAATAATNASPSSCGAGYLNDRQQWRDQPAFDHLVSAPTETWYPAHASERTDATA